MAALCLLTALPVRGQTDFTGFWKQDCSEAYGIQIKPYREGTYTVEFCGPGDPYCRSEPDPASETTIVGDPDFEVLSPTKIRETYAEGVTSTYIKCSDDPHPLLKYPEQNTWSRIKGIAPAVLTHVVYLVAMIALYRFVRRKTHDTAANRRIAMRSGIAAVLFAPGVFFAWPFAVPTFALVALVVHLFTIPAMGVSMVAGQLMYSVGPMLVLWLILLVIGHARLRVGSASRARGAARNEK